MPTSARTNRFDYEWDGVEPCRCRRAVFRGVLAAGIAGWCVALAGCACSPAVKPIMEGAWMYEQISFPRISGAVTSVSCCW